jgi:hypothetical protein
VTTTSKRSRPSSAKTLKPAQPVQKTPAQAVRVEATETETPDRGLAEIRQAISHAREHVADTTETLTQDTKGKVELVKRGLQVHAVTLQNKARKTMRQAGNLTGQARRKLPSPTSGRIGQVTGTVRQRPVPATAVVLGVVLVLLRQVRHRRRLRADS